MADALALFLKTVPIFSTLKETDLEELGKRFSMRIYDPGEAIIKQGRFSDNLYVVFSGSVEVRRSDPTHPDPGILIASMSRGDCFGEAALFHNVKRTAHIIAKERTEALTIGKVAFMKYLQTNSDTGVRVLYEMLKHLFMRLAQTSGELQNERDRKLREEKVELIVSEFAP